MDLSPAIVSSTVRQMIWCCNKLILINWYAVKSLIIPKLAREAEACLSSISAATLLATVMAATLLGWVQTRLTLLASPLAAASSRMY